MKRIWSFGNVNMAQWQRYCTLFKLMKTISSSKKAYSCTNRIRHICPISSRQIPVHTDASLEENLQHSFIKGQINQYLSNIQLVFVFFNNCQVCFQIIPSYSCLVPHRPSGFGSCIMSYLSFLLHSAIDVLWLCSSSRRNGSASCGLMTKRSVATAKAGPVYSI